MSEGNFMCSRCASVNLAGVERCFACQSRFVDVAPKGFFARWRKVAERRYPNGR